MNKPIKTYIEELEDIYDQIDKLWEQSEADDNFGFTETFTTKLTELYNRKYTLKELINKGEFK